VDEQEIRDLLKALAVLAEAAPGALELDVLTTDPTDNVYLACAVEAGVSHLVTGNLKHYAEVGETYHGVQILALAAFLTLLEAGEA
jgi:predicted nucleic acid-binding protein